MKKLPSVFMSIRLFYSAPALLAQTVSKNSIEHKKNFPNFAEQFKISLIRLIANPEKYHGKTMLLVGYLNLEFEVNALYLHREDFEQGISVNGIWIDVTDNFLKEKDLASYNKKYVIIEATFDMYNRGHFGMFGGSIVKITRLDIWRDK